ncbi:hypothetical protein OESDEN_04401 [Oesophagostomum dentatum]|uniref:Uncharacterized protein n=1 Tax=Oesophagostomum dentatum TaxID=61180 RepID=A0A0B1TIN8_OESDE|nr:hypothetical protein OESDEN_04401 [Oesophagostomum dentatum]
MRVVRVEPVNTRNNIVVQYGGIVVQRFVLSYVPGGERGLRFLSSLCTGFLRKSPTTVLPI